MLSLTHPEILRAERFGSRDVLNCRCTYCDSKIDEDDDYIFDRFGRCFCSEGCQDKHRSRYMEV